MYLDQYAATSLVDLVARDASTAMPDWTGLTDTSVKTKRLLMSFTILVLWDFVITTGQSVDLFWYHRWSISKIVFLLNRVNGSVLMLNAIGESFYMGTSTKYCHVGPWIGFVTSTTLLATFNSVLLIRVYALWNRSPWVFYLCLSALIAHIGAYVGITGYAYSLSTWSVAAAPFTGCSTTGGYAKMYIVFINALIVETLIITLTVVKALPVVRPRVLKTPVYSLLLEDGLLYFALIIITQSIIVAAFFVPNYKFAEIVLGSYPSCVVMAISCNRLLLHAQELLMGKKENFTTDFNTSDLVTISSFSGRKKGPSSSLGFTFSQDLPGERVEMNSRQKSSRGLVSTTGAKQKPGVIRINEGAFTKSANQSSSRSGSSVDKDADQAGHYLDGIMVERRDVQQVDGREGPIEGELVTLPERGPFSYGNRRTILDGVDTSSVHDETTGNLIVSRIGRYN